MVYKGVIQKRFKGKKFEGQTEEQRENSSSYRITIPKALVLALGWNKGKLLTFSLEGGNRIVLRGSNKGYFKRVGREYPRNVKDANESFLSYD